MHDFDFARVEFIVRGVNGIFEAENGRNRRFSELLSVASRLTQSSDPEAQRLLQDLGSFAANGTGMRFLAPVAERADRPN